MKHNLNSTFIKKQLPKKMKYSIGDQKMKGLSLIVYPSGKKSFYFRKRLPNRGKIVQEVIGDASIITVNANRTTPYPL